ncbi:unnamed protein product [Phaedon cochleariae]|uniref:Solute-binding protein family 3/N-terminal domain-containing protein n=1 Tax=Phaedon cochleariae TaxID=80249 RepID=A0A9N9SG34_PHACE|nr:unnamed protein product [Phaedon cochleariae]
MLPFITCDNETKEVGGYVGDIWNIIQEKYRFKYTLICTSYDEGRSMNENGQADVFLSASVAEENLNNLYFSQPYFYNWYHLYLKAPKLHASSLSYLKTFSDNLWLTMAAILALLTMTLWLNVKILNKLMKVEPKVGIPSCFLSAASGFINQGRGQVLIALLLGVVLYAAMNAVLFSRLAISDVKFPFTSLQDIGKHRGLSLCLRTNSFVHDYFTTDDGVVVPEWKEVLNNKNCLDIIDQRNISKIICKEGIVIFENRVIMSAIAKRSAFPCEIVNFGTIYYQKGNVFAMTRALKEKRLIEKILMEMRSHGIYNRLEHKHVTSQKPSSGEIWNQVTMAHIKGILCMYLIAIVVSLGILVTEITIHRRG